MKKQKKPVILVLALAVLFGGVAFMNRPPTDPRDQAAPTKTPDQEDASAVGDQVSKDLASKKVTEPKMKTPPKKGMMGPGGSTLLKPDYKPQKPKPNPNSTTSQWYTNQTLNGN